MPLQWIAFWASCDNFLRNEEGTTAIEYAIIAAAMGSALLTAFNVLLEGGGLLAGIDDILNPPAPPMPMPGREG